MENKNQPSFSGSENPSQTQAAQAKNETPDQKKIRVARESRSILKQIDRLEKEIASDRRKLQQKEAKLASLVAKL